MNKKNLNFLRSYLYGYVSEGISEPDDVSVSIGKCALVNSP